MVKFWRSMCDVQMRFGSGLPMTGTHSVENNFRAVKDGDRRLNLCVRSGGRSRIPPVNRGNKVQGKAMSEKVVWQLLQQDATDAGDPASHRMIVAGRAPSYAGPPAANLNRFSCYSATPRFKRPSGTSAPSKIR
jgi:hypothetical protein